MGNAGRGLGGKGFGGIVIQVGGSTPLFGGIKSGIGGIKPQFGGIPLQLGGILSPNYYSLTNKNTKNYKWAYLGLALSVVLYYNGGKEW